MKYASLIILALLVGCSKKKIEITPEYIINENWSKMNDDPGGNSIKIEKMKVKKDSILNYQSLKPAETLRKLEEDSLFRWFANVKTEQGGSYEDRKIYFNKDNGFTWLNDVDHSQTEIFGNLEKGSWYKFSNLLSHPYFIYVYIDSSSTVHRFDWSPANY
jgi:hypothetical protein